MSTKTTMPNRRQSVLKACSIPLDWREKCNCSRIELALESGIRIYLQDLTVEEIVDCLDKHPQLVREWEIDIEERRGSGGWSYGKNGDIYELGEVGDAMVFTKVAVFESRLEVCAVFSLLSISAYLNTEIPAADLALKRRRFHPTP
ncbi:hypothetical protein [Janthinobacterium lividum]|uniref:Uncharacterized protein n=1 Tax=Janthinobacterium lividum TaxID=29581 RepID=A0ABU0XM28_9BURK|nr:hypothetical protein [Janthinobacterium lividum]MDQ4624569.1 hypothetical protein [Janthinobacterium lividum]MDQ4673827.1 hypothetical protein [Janthinobacterium lividum]MDQ4684557.1 hypothetical protein [Janthinobacterium lividum]